MYKRTFTTPLGAAIGGGILSDPSTHPVKLLI